MRKMAEGIFKILPLFLLEAFIGILTVVLVFHTGYYHGDFIPVPVAMDIASRLAFGLRCSLPMVMVLLAAITLVMIKRGFTAAINPLSGNEGLVQLEKNVLANTIEQFVMGFILMMIAATYLDSPQTLKLLPIYSFLFVVGRILFSIGYGIHPRFRSVGMTITLIATTIMLGVVIYSMSNKGLLYGLQEGTFDRSLPGFSVNKEEL